MSSTSTVYWGLQLPSFLLLMLLAVSLFDQGLGILLQYCLTWLGINFCLTYSVVGRDAFLRYIGWRNGSCGGMI